MPEVLAFTLASTSASDLPDIAAASAAPAACMPIAAPCLPTAMPAAATAISFSR